ncbi:MAG TPA: NAD(P)/FAD-dependent oxidoreductase [Methyloceanibacter sp.]|nr:NAD(P)/FAD-dependent oxidoreductase [Methyloceanibacter sp.]
MATKQDDMIWDAVIVGGGPAGLTGAIYLGRFRRNVLVVESGQSRAWRIPRTHNHPGFPNGIEGPDLLGRIHAQAEKYGAKFQEAVVTGLSKTPDGLFEVSVGDTSIRARFVLLATGVLDHDPELPGVDRAVERGLLRICPICDAYEVIGKKMGVIGGGSHSVREALFLRSYSEDVTLIHIREEVALSSEDRRELRAANVDLIESSIDSVVIENDVIEGFDVGGAEWRFDVVYSALGTSPQSALARDAGAAVNDAGCLEVSDHQQTSLDGLYAAGDLVRGLNQISVAQGEAAIAATDIHNRLRAVKTPALVAAEK